MPMTKLAIMSDLHIDINQFGAFEIKTLIETLKEEKIEHLHIAGDISNHHYTISQPFLTKIAEHFEVTYNLGNHDMLDLSEETISSLDYQLIPFKKTTLLAFHGWYDYSFYPEKSDQENLNFKNTFWFDRRLKRPFSDQELTKEICQKLEKILASLTGKVIVVMHFVPHSKFIMTHDKFRPFNAFLGSEQFHNIFQKYDVTDVIFGHSHRSYGEFVIDNIHYHSRPLSYRREWDLTIDYVNQNPKLNPTRTYNLSKRYNLVKKTPRFKDYQKRMLAKEFQNSMTVFNLS